MSSYALEQEGEETLNPIPLTLISFQKCTLGCPILDSFFNGGIPCGSITELVSESSCGKTQLSLQLLLCSLLPRSHGGLNSTSLYIFSEPPFPFRRLKTLSATFKHPNPSPSFDPCDHILVHGVQTSEELLEFLDRVETLISQPLIRPVKLVVLDSVAALFRSEFDNHLADLSRRSSLFFKIASKLKALASKFEVAIVVTNQVVDSVGLEGLNEVQVGNYSCLFSSGRKVCPALGLSWANCVNSRVFLSRDEEKVADNKMWGSNSQALSENGGFEDGYGDFRTRTRRKMQVVFAPHLPKFSCEFEIRRDGVFGVKP
ncbi:hypothetical protein AMTRI_Chr12g274520 [Amborella trichopoda]|uniref:RecA family profile 1 domain-containing protein n=1 Tax=Amborella trichopoda TaxID=13333 RepID=W1PBM2_AMBTC|nr:DNA repair protein XRCC3 homolog [Amborella trichopoda]ERN07307.1 hypothetical protein AMTR_s00019p00219950 [Amborella trichopoda]|eukprot:XP_006845632.1 DNA repair protein XRCC3 homolog [Amborella trichopoda]